MKTKTTPDAIPHRYRDNLVPAAAVSVPEQVATASEQLRVAGLAAERAFADRRAAETAAKAAPRRDSAAGIEAVQRGEDPPPATAPEKEREAETARQRLHAAKAIAQRASVALERAIRAHGGEWVEPQRAAAATIVEDALAEVDALEAMLDTLAVSAGIVASLQTTPEGRVIDRGRMFKPRTVGFNGQGGSPASRLLGELRQQIAAAVPDPLPVDRPLTPEEEALRDTQHAYRQMAQGGVVVAGGGWD